MKNIHSELLDWLDQTLEKINYIIDNNRHLGIVFMYTQKEKLENSRDDLMDLIITKMISVIEGQDSGKVKYSYYQRDFKDLYYEFNEIADRLPLRQKKLFIEMLRSDSRL